MSVLITSDLHLSDNPRDNYRFAFLDSLPATCRQRDVETVLILGDMTEEKDRHGAWLVNRIVEGVMKIANVAEVIFIRGNHDYIDIEHPFFRMLGCLPNVLFISKPIHSADDTFPMPAFLLPHTTDYKRDWEGLNFKSGDWIFCHQTFEGADGGTGRKLSGISPSVFPDGAHVYSGDVHVPQKLGPITYVGAPYTVDFGDDYQPRYLLLEGEKVKSIRLAARGKRLIEIHKLSDLEKFTDEIADGDIVKVRFHLAHKDYQEWPRLKKAVLQWGESERVQVHMVQPVVAQASVNQRRREVDNSQTDEDLFDEYCKHRGVDTKTQRTGQIILGEA